MTGVLAWLILACLPADLVQPRAGRLTGIVLDTSGGVVAGATVTLEIESASVGDVRTGFDGRFALDTGGPTGARLRVAAPGFDGAVLAATPGEEMRIVLLPGRLAEVVAVTASRGARLGGPASVSVLASADLLTSPAGAIDDALRSTPGFSLFRRSSSRVANPTTQGVTLRGISGSGASRTLVLADGQPLNDPFGSWVYWNRIPQAAVERVEVVRGAAGDLYGPDALGGVVQILTFAPDRARLRAIAELGSHGTARASVFTSAGVSGLAVAAAGEWLDTGGVPILASTDRGPIDVPAGSDHRTAFLSLGHNAENWRASIRGSVFTEDRGNGTPLQVNATDSRQLSAEAATAAAGGSFVVRAALGAQTYTQDFTAVAADRASERLTAGQFTPTGWRCWSAQWSRPLGSHALLVGAEGHWTGSTNAETRYTAEGTPLPPVVSGGKQRTLSGFARVTVRATEDVTLDAGVRSDSWQSDSRDPALPSRSVTVLVPRAAVEWRLSSLAAVRAAAYRGQRTPTLNELHRDFRVGNVVTAANPLLEPERLTGFEGGLLLSWTRLSVRATGFRSHVDGVVANVTLRTTPALIVRQRENVSRMRVSGAELEADLRVHQRLALTGWLALTDARFAGSVELPDLAGKRVPQVPLYQLGLGLNYVDRRGLTLRAQLRVMGQQYDDDLNQLELHGATVLDASATRSFARGVQLFVAVENLLGSEYDVARTPVRSVGWPRTVRVGLRLTRP